MEFDLAIIGGGPAGYTAAAAATKEGLTTVLFEQGLLGGTCLNRGCIPTKALLHAAETWKAIGSSDRLGIHVEGALYDFAAMHERKAAVVDQLRGGVEKLMAASKVTVVNGHAEVPEPGVVACDGERYAAANIIVAAGSVPAVPPIPGVDLPGVYTSDDLLEGSGKQLASLAIIGGGVIGVEMASLYAALGCQVTVIEALDHLLPAMDREIAQRLTAAFKKDGVAVAAKARVAGIAQADGGLQVTYLDAKEAEHQVVAEGVLVATGRRAAVEGVFAGSCMPTIQRGIVATDEAGRTSVPNVYVVGDAKANTIQLAHVAEAQARNAVAAIAGKPLPVDMSTVPSCVYTDPEIASVGMTDKEAKAAGYAVRTAKHLAGANGKSVIAGCDSGYLKLVSNADTGRILGAQAVFPRATDLVGELAIAVQKGLTAEDLTRVIHPHPTFCESISAAAEAL